MPHTDQKDTRPYFDRSNLIGYYDPFWNMRGKFNSLKYYSDDEIDSILLQYKGVDPGTMARGQGRLYYAFLLKIDAVSAECIWDMTSRGKSLGEAIASFNNQYPNHTINNHEYRNSKTNIA